MEEINDSVPSANNLLHVQREGMMSEIRVLTSCDCNVEVCAHEDE